MARTSSKPTKHHKSIKFFSLQLFLCFALAMVCPKDPPAELDLISEFPPRVFTSPVDVNLEKEDTVVHSCAPASEPSLGHFGSWRSPDQQPPISKLGTHDSVFFQMHLQQLPDYNAEALVLSQSSVSSQGEQMRSPEDGNIPSNIHQKNSEEELLLAGTGTAQRRSQTDEGVALLLYLSSSGKLLHGSNEPLELHDLNKPFGDDNETSGVNLDNIAKHFEGSLHSTTSEERREPPADLEGSCRKFKASFTSASCEAHQVLTSAKQHMSIDNYPPNTMAMLNSLPAWPRAKTRPRSRKSGRGSPGKACPTLTANIVSPCQGFKTSQVPWSPKISHSLKDSEASAPEKLLRISVNPTKLITSPSEYWNIRSKALSYLRKVSDNFKTLPRGVRLSSFHSASERLGDLELKKLGLGQEMENLCTVLKREWIRTSMVHGQVKAETEFQNKYRVNSVEYATKTYLYFLNVINDLFVPPVFGSKELLQKAQKDNFNHLKTFWLRLHLKGSSEVEKLILEIDRYETNKTLKLFWCMAAFCLKVKYPKVYNFIKSGEHDLNRHFKMIVADKILLAGTKIKLFEIDQTWKAVFSMDIKFKLPQHESTCSKETNDKKISFPLVQNKKRKPNRNEKSVAKKIKIHHFYRNASEQENETRLYIDCPSKGINTSTKNNAGINGSGCYFEKNQLDDSLASEAVKTNSAGMGTIENLEAEKTTHISHSYEKSEKPFCMENEPHDPENGYLLRDYQSFRNEHFNTGWHIKSDARRKYLFSELEYFGRDIIHDLNLESEYDNFLDRMKSIFNEKYRRQKYKILGRSNENRLKAIEFATRTAIFFINLLNKVFSPRLYPTDLQIKKAQIEGFECLKSFWISLYTIPNSTRCDKISLSALSILHELCRNHPSNSFNLAWICFLYWIREKLPSGFYKILSDNDSINRNIKWLLGDITLARGFRSMIDDPKVKELSVFFKEKFILRRPA